MRRWELEECEMFEVLTSACFFDSGSEMSASSDFIRPRSSSELALSRLDSAAGRRSGDEYRYVA